VKKYGLDSSGLEGCCEHGNEPSVSIKGKEDHTDSIFTMDPATSLHSVTTQKTTTLRYIRVLLFPLAIIPPGRVCY
jgi:hypothetical protein